VAASDADLQRSDADRIPSNFQFNAYPDLDIISLQGLKLNFKNNRGASCK
jgi:hypothetical protein